MLLILSRIWSLWLRMRKSISKWYSYIIWCVSLGRLHIWFQKVLLYSRHNFSIKSILYYLSFPINRMQKLPIPLNVFQFNCMIVFDGLLKMMSLKKFYSYLKWLCTRNKGFIVSYFNDLYNLLNLALNLPNYIRDNSILQMPEQHSFALLWLLNLSFFPSNPIVVALIL